jgi:hypothetical protein
MKYGMYARDPAYYAEAPSKTIMENGRGTDESNFEEATSLAEASRVLSELDRYVLGFSLDWHHEFFFECKARCYIFRGTDASIGYVYVRPNGGVGPMAVSSGQFARPVLESARRSGITSPDRTLTP